MVASVDKLTVNNFPPARIREAGLILCRLRAGETAWVAGNERFPEANPGPSRKTLFSEHVA